MKRFKSLCVTATLLAISVAPANAINKGSVATSAPNVVNVIKEYANGARYGNCSGALLSPRVVVTAAHCVTEDTGLLAQNVWVAPAGASFKEHTEAGKNYSILENTSTVAESRAIYEQFKAIAIQITSSYYSSSDIVEDNDVAFISLAKPMALTSNIVLASDEETENFITKTTTVRIYGYGQTTFDSGMSLKPMTTTMTLSFKSDSVKNSAYLVSKTTDACPGDSGGPVIVSTPSKLYLVGIISGGFRADTGPECSGTYNGSYYTLITLVTKYANLAFAAAVAADKYSETLQAKAQTETQNALAGQTKAQSDLKLAQDAQSKAELNAKIAQDAQAKAEADAKAAKDAQSKAEADTKAAKDAQSKSEADAKAALDAQLIAKSETEAAQKALAAETEAKLNAQSESKVAKDAQAAAEASAKAAMDAKAQADADILKLQSDLDAMKAQLTVLAATVKKLQADNATAQKKLTAICKIKPKPKGC